MLSQIQLSDLSNFFCQQSNDSNEKDEDLLPAPIPKPRTMTPVKETPQKTTSPMKLFPSANGKTPTAERKLFKTPQKTPNYLRPTTASKMRMSPRKHLSPLHQHRAKEDNANDITPCPRSGFAAMSPGNEPLNQSKTHLLTHPVFTF